MESGRDRVVLIAPLVLFACLLIRILLDFFVAHQGFFIGQAADTFLRTERSWLWSKAPFLTTDPPMWPPLQYAIVGIMYRIASPLRTGSTVLMPILANHLAFAGSILLLFLCTRRLAGLLAAVAACIIATLMTYDVWMTLSGQVEPILTFLALLLAYVFLLEAENPRPVHLVAFGGVSFLLEATHYSGWFLAFPAVVMLLVKSIRGDRAKDPTRASQISGIVGLVLASIFPLAWLVGSQLQFGDPFAFLHWTAETHASYASMPFWERLLSFPLAAFDAAPFLSVVSLVAIPLAVRLDRRYVHFFLPFGPQVIFLTLANILVLGPTRYMPRAALPVLWASLTATGLLLVFVRAYHVRVMTPILITGFAGFMILTTIRTFQFTNRIGNNLRTTASALSKQFRTSQARVLANAMPWTQTHALAVLSLAPDRIGFLSNRDLLSTPDLRIANHDLILLNDPRIMQDLSITGETILENSDFILIRPSRDSSQILPLPPIDSDWTSDSDNTFFIQMPGNTSGLGFRNVPNEPWEVAEAHSDMHLKPHGCYILHFEIKDYAPESDKKWQYLHQVVANGIVIWSYDPNDLSFDGWQDVNEYFMPSAPDIRLSFQVVALSPPDPSFAWWYPSEFAFRSVSMGPCP